MNCPKCKTEISDKDLACPSCKKVLRLECPSCSSISKKSTCEKCGSIILNKCYKCGKLNSASLEKCPNCGLNVNASIGLRESIIEEFAVLTIEITNFEDIESAFKSKKITSQFKKNLYAMIKKIAHQKKLRVQFLEDTFIIRFCKDSSFIESTKSALDFSIYVAQSVTEINKKLFDAKGVAIKTQMAVQKRDVYSKPSEYKSGLNINVVYSSSASSHLFNNVEVVVDSYIYQAAKLKYPFQSLSAVFVKNRMVMFFELILHQLIKLEEESEVDINAVKLPKNVDFEPEEEIDESYLINFTNLNCTFLKAKNETLLTEIEKIYSQAIENPIISIKGKQSTGKLALVDTKDIQNIYKDYNVMRFSCHPNNKYAPYGLFKQLILAYREMIDIDIMLNQDKIELISTNGYIQDLFKMHADGHTHPEDLRSSYFEAFTKLISNIPFKMLFVIDDFENTDESSLEIIQWLIENKELGNIGFILSVDEDYSLHRKIYRLMRSNNYFEIELKPSSNKTVISKNLKALIEVKDSFFMEKVLENTKGSEFYFNEAINYLCDMKILEKKSEKYSILQEQMLVLPKNLNELVQKRIRQLQIIPEAFDLFGSILLIGEKTPFTTIQLLGFKEDVKIVRYLKKQGFIEIVEDKDIVIKNFNLYRKNFIETCEKDRLQTIAVNMLEKLYIKIEIPNNIKAEILEYAKLQKEAFAQWHSLAMISSQIGDYCAYLNCTNKFLSLVDNVIDADTNKTVEQVKLDVYSELASLLYKYYPDKTLKILQLILGNLESINDDKKIKEVANKLVQSCLISGNYRNALEYIGKIISRMPASSFDPNDKEFNLNYFLVNLVTLEIYYNLGRLNECIELGDELFKHISFSTLSETVLPESFSKKQFDDALLDGLFFTALSKIIQLKPDRKEFAVKLSQTLPQNYGCFKLLALFIEFIEDKDIMADMKSIAQSGLNDKYSQILFPALQAFISMKYKDWDNLGNYIHNAKTKASALHLHQIEYFCDLLIGYAYKNLGNIKKSKQIYYSVLDESGEKGLKNITYMSWLLMAQEEFQGGNFEIASGILNNSILNMENDENCTDFFVMMFKSLSAEISLNLNQFEQALFCAEQSFEIAVKNNLNLYIPNIAQMLGFIYNKILTTEQDESIIAKYKKKFEKVMSVLPAISPVE